MPEASSNSSSFRTTRLVLRRPRLADAPAIFERYASDPEVTRFLSWPRHITVADTRAFVEFSDAEWTRWPAGPYLVESHEGILLGGSGLAFEAPDCASTGYVFARDAWGQGYATEALGGIVTVARALGVVRLHALCHAEHRPSWRVLEKNGFLREAVPGKYASFPNLEPDTEVEVLSYTLRLG